MDGDSAATIKAKTARQQRWARIALALIVAAALAQGIFRAVTIPLWKNYDEPGHMEYVLYVAKHHALPGKYGLDLALRQQISDTYAHRDCQHDQPGQIIGCLAFHQFDEQPAYYVLQAAFQIALRPPTIPAQVHVARVVSVLLMAAMLWVSYQAMRLIFPANPLPAVAVPALMSVLPGFLNSMTSVNNDVMAAFSSTVLIASTTLLIKRGITWQRMLLIFLPSVALCALSKTTAVLLIPAALVGLWLGVDLPKPVLYAAPLLPILLAIPFALTAQGSADWLKPASNIADRVQTDAPLGRYAFELMPQIQIIQQLTPADAARLRGQTVTLGAWLRAPRGAGVAYPLMLVDGPAAPGPAAQPVGPEWTFVAQTVHVDAQAPYILVGMQGLPERSGPLQIDGVVLAAGDFASDGPPEWDGPDGATGRWGGQPYANLLLNGSAERGWLLIKPAINRRLPAVLSNDRLQALYNWRISGPTYLDALSSLFISFWGSYGWGRASFGRPMTILFVVATLLAVAGLLRLAIRAARGKQPLAAGQAKIGVTFAVFALIALAFSFLRTDPPQPGVDTFIPGARYFYTVTLPVIAALVVGVGAWVPKRLRAPLAAVSMAFLYVAHMISTLIVQLPTLK